MAFQTFWLRRPAALCHFHRGIVKSPVLTKDKPMLTRLTSFWHAARPSRRCTAQFGSFEEAAEEAARSGSTYASRTLSQSVVASTLEYRGRGRDILVGPLSPMVCRRLWALDLCRPATTLDVLDFGGAAGQHYFEAQAYFGDRIALRWRVVETEAMVHAAQVLACDGLSFFSDLSTAVREFTPDLVFSSGALQCLQSPVTTLRQLVNVGARHLFFTRLSLHPRGETCYIVESSPSWAHGPVRRRTEHEGIAAYPLTIVPVRSVEDCLGEAYHIELCLDESDLKGNPLVDGESIRRGYFCTRKAAVPHR